MLRAIDTISAGTVFGIPSAHTQSFVSVMMRQTSARERLPMRGARAVTGGTDILPQEFLHALHPLFVLDLRERVPHGIDGVELGEVHLPRLAGLLDLVDHVHLLRRELTKRHIRPHA